MGEGWGAPVLADIVQYIGHLAGSGVETGLGSAGGGALRNVQTGVTMLWAGLGSRLGKMTEHS